MRPRVSTATEISGRSSRQGQEPVRAQVMFGAEPERSAEQQADLELVSAVDVEQRVGQVAVPAAHALAAIGREFEAVGLHNAPPRDRPTAATANPMNRLTSRLAAALRS